MKKNRILLIIALVLVLVLVISFIKKELNNYNINKLLNEYDYIIVGTDCSCKSWIEKCTHGTYGIKNGSIKKLNEKFKANKDNIYEISYSYRDGKNHYNISNSIDEKGQIAFNNIVNIYEKNNNQNLINSFIISKNNYYIQTYEDDKYVIYKYVTEDNSLKVLLNIDYCEITCFYEK